LARRRPQLPGEGGGEGGVGGIARNLGLGQDPGLNCWLIGGGPTAAAGNLLQGAQTVGQEAQVMPFQMI
jgi:hypothetical protein